jgi:hypothetical protein
MEKIILGLIAIAFLGFIFGLAGKSRSVKKKSIERNEFYQRLTVFSLILMLLCAIIYSFIV